MKAKKIIKSIVKLTVISGIAYFAYKICEYSGRDHESVEY